MQILATLLGLGLIGFGEEPATIFLGLLIIFAVIVSLGLRGCLLLIVLIVGAVMALTLAIHQQSNQGGPVDRPKPPTEERNR